MTETISPPPGAQQNTALVVAKLSTPRQWMVWGIILLFTTMAVHWSMRNARLAQDPTFDDVGYFIEGAQRQAVLDESGLEGLAKDLVQHPPHSAFSSLLALTSFEILGVNDWAPYVFNGFVLAAFVFFCCRIYGDLRSVSFYCLLLFCLTIPFALRAIHDFRPDFTVALATAAFAWFGLAAVAGREEDEIRHSVVAGILFGAALWIKPTVFAHTLAIALVVGTCIAGSRWFPGLGYRDFRRSLVSALRFGGIGIALGAPYFLLNGRQTVYYFVFNTRVEKISNFKGSLWEVFRKFVWDGTQTYTMGRYLWLSLAICAVGMAWAARRGHARIAFQTAGLLLAAAASLSVFVYGRFDNEYFGMPYQMMVLFAALTPLAAIIRAHPAARAVAPALLLISFTPAFFTPLGLFWAPMPEADPQYGWNRKIVDAIVRDSDYRRDKARRDTALLPVFLTFAGSVNGNCMWWDCIKERLPFTFSDLHRSGDSEAQLKLAKRAAYVVIATPSAESVYMELPSGGLEDAMMTSLQRDADFREVKVNDDAQPPYRLFRNLRIFGKGGFRNALTIGWPYTGFLPVEGPYPNLGLPQIRWGVFPGSTVTVTVPDASAGMLRFSVSAHPGAVIKVRFNGSPLGEYRQESTEFDSAEFPLLLRAGSNVVSLDYQIAGADTAPGTRAVLFTRFEIETTP